MKKWLVMGLFSMAGLALLSGCGGTITASVSWPGISVAKGAVYLGLGDRIYALGAEEGKILWNFAPENTHEFFFAAPTHAKDVLYVCSSGSAGGAIYALDAESGAGKRLFPERQKETRTFGESLQRWLGTLFSPEGPVSFYASPLVEGDALYLGSTDRRVYALELETGAKLWEFTTGNWVWATPVFSGSHLYVASMDHKIYCLDAKKGELKWTFEAGGAVAAAPAVAEGTLYFGAFDGKVYALDAETGQERWTFALETPTTQKQNWVWSTPATSGDKLYFGSLDHKVYALDSRTGKKLWDFATGNVVCAAPLILEGTLYVASGDGGVYALDAEAGTQKWAWKPAEEDEKNPPPIFSSPVSDGNRLYLVNMEGKAFALNLEDGTLVWSFTRPKE
ncbi:MAG: outer membrane protein assembly factor BamB family protein [Anaerolineae bacterium]